MNWVLRSPMVVLVVAILCGPLSAVDASDAPKARILVVNLYTEAVDAQIGDEPVFSVEKLSAGTPSSLLPIPADSPARLYFKESGSTDWRYFQNEEGSPAELSFGAGSTTLIRIGPEGGVECIDVPELGADIENACRIIVLNGSDQPLESLTVVDTGLAPIIEASEVPAQAVTMMAGVPSGLYGLRWRQAGIDYPVSGEGGVGLPMTPLVGGIAYLVMGRDAPQFWKLGDF